MLYLFAYYYYGSICSFVLHHYIARGERYTAPVHDYYKNKKIVPSDGSFGVVWVQECAR